MCLVLKYCKSVCTVRQNGYSADVGKYSKYGNTHSVYSSVIAVITV